MIKIQEKVSIFEFKNHKQLVTEAVSKVSLSACDDKRVVCENCIVTLPCGYQKFG